MVVLGRDLCLVRIRQAEASLHHSAEWFCAGRNMDKNTQIWLKMRLWLSLGCQASLV